MAIKIIKFDLPINGTKVTTLEALRDNLTDEIVKLARSGQLERWFKSRQMQEQAQAVAAAVSQHAEDKALFLALCAVLEVEVHPDDASAIFDAPPIAGRHIGKKQKNTEECNVNSGDILLKYIEVYKKTSIISDKYISREFYSEGMDIEDYNRNILDAFREILSEIHDLLSEMRGSDYIPISVIINSRPILPLRNIPLLRSCT